MSIEEQFTTLMKPLMDLDTTKWTDHLFRTLAKTNVPGIDMDALVASRRDDLNALAAANNQAIEGIKSIMGAQKKILEDLIEGTVQGAQKSAGHAAAGAGSPKEAVAGQLDLAKESFEQATANMRALAEAVIEANRLTMRPIIERIPDAIDDAKDIIKAG